MDSEFLPAVKHERQGAFLRGGIETHLKLLALFGSQGNLLGIVISVSDILEPRHFEGEVVYMVCLRRKNWGLKEKIMGSFFRKAVLEVPGYAEPAAPTAAPLCCESRERDGGEEGGIIS
jgi:hypothetical protein